MILISLFITIIYLLLIGSFVFGFDKIPVFHLEDITSKTKFSIVIPFRNEAENLSSLLNSIECLNYPKHLFEIIFVDDDSEDNSVDIIKKALNGTKENIQIVLNNRKTNSPKKDAITSALEKAKYEWIITTDADCILPKYWLDSFDEFIQKNNSVFIAAPVSYTRNNSFLNRFQTLDILSLQGATIGGFGLNKPFLCNGANLAYKASIFNEVNGFQGNTNIASGDDIFLLEKVHKKQPTQVHYLKCKKAIVKTKSQPTWSALISQRRRWAAKTSSYNNLFGKLTGLAVLLMNILIIIGLLMSFLGVLKFKTFFYIIFIKFNIDFFLIYKSSLFFNQKDILKSYISGFIVYPFFSIYIAFTSSFSGYKWKGRYFKK